MEEKDYITKHPIMEHLMDHLKTQQSNGTSDNTIILFILLIIVESDKCDGNQVIVVLFILLIITGKSNECDDALINLVFKQLDEQPNR